MNLFDPGLTPFTIALLVMGLLLLFELASALFGASLSHLFDHAMPHADVHGHAGPHVDADGGHEPGALSGLLSWLYVGRAPLLILLAAFLTGFGLTGFILQSAVKAIAGFYLPSWLA
jgi:hypothetical protein